MKRRQSIYRTHYTLMDELVASPTKPLPDNKRIVHMTKIHQALGAMISDDAATTDDWRVVSDIVNMIETLTTHAGGHWPDCDGDLIHMKDETGLLLEAMTAMAVCGKRHVGGEKIRLDEAGANALRAIVGSYEDVISALPERSMIKCHRLTERRMQEILQGRRRAHDVELVAI